MQVLPRFLPVPAAPRPPVVLVLLIGDDQGGVWGEGGGGQGGQRAAGSQHDLRDEGDGRDMVNGLEGTNSPAGKQYDGRM